MTEYFVHRRVATKTTAEYERQVELEYQAMDRGYKLRYEVSDNIAYNVYVELESDVEFVEFKLRCG